MGTELWAIGTALLVSLTSSVEAAIWKKSSAGIRKNIGSFVKNRYIYIAGLLVVFNSVLFIMALRGGELSVIYPITSLKYVFIAFLSVRFFNERIELNKWMGIIFIIIGVSLIGVGG